jgi:hypothetical protein
MYHHYFYYLYHTPIEIYCCWSTYTVYSLFITLERKKLSSLSFICSLQPFDLRKPTQLAVQWFIMFRALVRPSWIFKIMLKQSVLLTWMHASSVCNIFSWSIYVLIFFWPYFFWCRYFRSFQKRWSRQSESVSGIRHIHEFARQSKTMWRI